MRLALSLRRSFLVHTRTVTMVAATLDAARAKIADQVKVDLLSKTHVDENARKVKEITRTFICEYESLCNLFLLTMGLPSGHYYRYFGTLYYKGTPNFDDMQSPPKKCTTMPRTQLWEMMCTSTPRQRKAPAIPQQDPSLTSLPGLWKHMLLS